MAGPSFTAGAPAPLMVVSILPVLRSAFWRKVTNFAFTVSIGVPLLRSEPRRWLSTLSPAAQSLIAPQTVAAQVSGFVPG
jgi:hypothetical protein